MFSIAFRDLHVAQAFEILIDRLICIHVHLKQLMSISDINGGGDSNGVKRCMQRPLLQFQDFELIYPLLVLLLQYAA